MAIKFKKSDQVIVIAGSNKGKIGKIISIQDDKVLVDGINLATVHKKPTSNQSGEIVKVAKPIHISNISFIENDKPVKIGFKILPDSNKKFAGKIRISKKTLKEID
jgi:large subunit ribosomal protein L24